MAPEIIVGIVFIALGIIALVVGLMLNHTEEEVFNNFSAGLFFGVLTGGFIIFGAMMLSLPSAEQIKTNTPPQIDTIITYSTLNNTSDTLYIYNFQNNELY